MEAVSGRREGEGTSVSVGGETIQIRVGPGSDAATADVPRSFNFEAGAQKDRTWPGRFRRFRR